MTPKYCPDCGAKSASATSKFCASCGQPLDSMTKRPTKTSTASTRSNDADESDVFEVPDIGSIQVITEVDDEQSDHFGKSFSFGGKDFQPAKFKPRSLTR